jgi:conjugal transfer/entry exclusion protein
MSDQSNWNEYSKLVLKELERLANGIENLQNQIQSVKNDMLRYSENENKLNQIMEWKKKIEDITTPTQLKNVFQEVDDLKSFKLKMVTLFLFLQFSMGFLMWYISNYGAN